MVEGKIKQRQKHEQENNFQNVWGAVAENVIKSVWPVPATLNGNGQLFVFPQPTLQYHFVWALQCRVGCTALSRQTAPGQGSAAPHRQHLGSSGDKAEGQKSKQKEGCVHENSTK